MNQAEIMTLLSSKVPAKKIRIAIMAGKLSGILIAADRDINKAANFRENADWSEMLRIMEGTLEKEVDYQADDIPVADRGKTKRAY
jgi:hypothetical protein